MCKSWRPSTFLLCAAASFGLIDLNAHADDSQTRTFNESFHSEAIIDASIENVWPYVLDIKKWMTAHDLISISGSPNTEGEVVKVIPRNVPTDAPKEHYAFYEVTKVIPNKQIVLKVYSAPAGSFGRHVLGFDTVTLISERGKTRVVFDMNDESTGPYMDNVELEKSQKQESENTAAILKTYWANLRELVAKDTSHEK